MRLIRQVILKQGTKIAGMKKRYLMNGQKKKTFRKYLNQIRLKNGITGVVPEYLYKSLLARHC